MASEQDPVTNRWGHVAAVWGDITLIWGGYFPDDISLANCDPCEVYCHQDGVWISKTTHGEVPPVTINGVGEVVGDYFYVLCLWDTILDIERTNEIHRLDLHTWEWSKLNPRGTKPLKSADLASWVSGENIFLFGGFTQSELDADASYPPTLEVQFEQCNQLVYYNCRDNSWNWPIASGQAPSPRSGHAAFSVSGLYMDPECGK